MNSHIEKSEGTASNTPPEPDEHQIELHLDFIVEQFAKVGDDVLIELRALDPLKKRPAINRQFALDEKPKMIKAALDWNGAGYNVYIGINPRKPETPRMKAGVAADVVAAVFQSCDADSPEAVENLRHIDNGPPFGFFLVTGAVPTKRIWAHWALEEPITNLSAWTRNQEIIERRFGGDHISDLPRIGRLGGLISRPSAAKIARGYVAELVTIGEIEGVDPVESEAFQVWAIGHDKAEGGKADGPDIDTGPEPMTEAEVAGLMEICRVNKGGWRDAMKKLMAHKFGLKMSVVQFTKWAGTTGLMPEGTEEAWSGLIAWFAAQQPDIALPAFQPQEQAAPEPVDVWADAATIASPLQDSVPPALRAWAEAEGERLTVDPIQMVAVALPVVAASISDDWLFQPKEHDTEWLEQARLWAMIVLAVGGKKSDSQDSATAPAEALEKAWSIEHAEEMRRWTQDCATAQEEKATPPGEPRRKRIMTTDTTVERLSDLLRDDGKFEAVTGKVLVKAGELTQWIYQMEAYQSGKQSASRPNWLKTYDGGFAMIDRVGRGTLAVKNWSTCVAGVIQPGPIAKLGPSLGTDGLLQRFIIIEPHRPTPPENDDRPIQGGEEARKTYEQTLRRLVEMTPIAHGRGNKPLMATPEARAWRQTLRQRRIQLEKARVYPTIMMGWVAKWDGLWARLALTFHMFHTVASTDMKKVGPVSEDAGRWAHNLIVKVLEPHAAQFYGETLGLHHEHYDSMLAAAGWILTHPSVRVTRREMQRSSGSRKYTAAEIIEIMGMLEDRGWCEVAALDAQRKPSAWTINPRVYSDLAKRKDDETSRREDVKRLIAAEAEKRRASRAR